MTLEEAQQEILRLDAELKTVTAERDTLFHEHETVKASLEEARTLNQKLFLEVRQGSTETPPEPDEPDVPSCVELAKKIKF